MFFICKLMFLTSMVCACHVGMKKYEHRSRQWHAECFTCLVCKKQIGTSSFIPRANDLVCVPCYERQYSQSCTKCGLVRYHIRQLPHERGERHNSRSKNLCG